MTRTALLGPVLAVALLAGCKSATLEQQGVVPPQAVAAAAAQTPAAPAPSPEEIAQGYQILKLTAQLPAALMQQAQQKADCPRTLVGALFGLELADPHGCVIGTLVPGGLAEQAGLKTGDSIAACNDQSVSCPQEFVPLLRASVAGPAKGKLVLTIHRPLPPAPAK